MRKNKKRAILSVFLIFSMLLTGCGQTQKEDIPELLEPAVANTSYRPVERGNIGSADIVTGTVVPTPYCHFYPSDTAISSIEVDIGDYVEAGSVLAYADIDVVREEINSLKQQLDNMKSKSSVADEIYQETIKELQYKQKAYQEAGDSSGAEEINIQIAVTEENHRYDTMLEEIHEENVSEEIAKREQTVADGTLTARHSGYVTYIKDISKSRTVASSENVVVISDMEAPYIELKDWKIDDFQKHFSKYDLMYAKIENQNQAVTEWSYSEDELIYAKVADKYPNVRLKLKENIDLTVGDTVPIYFSHNDKTDVLVIGNDSVYNEGEETYVYVKNKSGERERRNVELGESDSLYHEVIDGVTEGEMVFYRSDAAMPASYNRYSVTAGNYEAVSQTKHYKLANSVSFPYISEFDATVSSLAVGQGNEVKKGDLLCTLDTGGGQAALEAAQNEIKHTEAAYQEEQKNYDAQIVELKNAVAAYHQQEVPAATDTDAQKEYLYQEEQLNCEIQIIAYQKKISELNYTYNMEGLKKAYEVLNKRNDGTGKMNIYASEDGIISKLEIKQGDKVKKGDQILTIQCGAGDKLLITMEGKNKTAGKNTAANLGQSITFQSEGKSCNGVCIGEPGEEDKYYLTTINDEVYANYSVDSTSGQPQFYASVEDETIYKDKPDAVIVFPGILIRDAIVLPEDMVYTEYDKEKNQNYQYVWRVVQDELVKQYVETNSTLSSDGKVVILSGVKSGDVLAVATSTVTGGEN